MDRAECLRRAEYAWRMWDETPKSNLEGRRFWLHWSRYWFRLAVEQTIKRTDHSTR